MVEWIVDLIDQYGYFGVAALMLLENVFPPLPSELIMPFAGFAASRGAMSAVGVVVAGTCGSLLGTLVWYWVGARLGSARLERWAARHGRWLTVAPQDVREAKDWFCRHGTKAMLLGRMVPAVRSLISLPAGMAQMPLSKFLLWTTLGSVAYNSAHVALGFMLEQRYDQVARWLDPVTKLIIAAALLGYFYRVLTWKPKPGG